MSEQYLAHFAVIILPLFIVQIWSFRRPFYTLPWRSSLMAVYGATGAIWDQHYPIHILGISASFASIPIIISFLYGKRWAGVLSTAIFVLWTFGLHPPSVYAIILSIVLYALLPLMLARRYEDFSRKTRLLLVILVSLWTIVMQGLMWVIHARMTHPSLFTHPSVVFHNIFVQLIPILSIAFIVQSILTMIPMLLLENVIEDGRIRLAMADNEHRYQSMLEFNPLGICIIDRNNCFVYANPAYQKITGYALADLLGHSRFELWFPEDREYASQFSRTLETGEVLMGVPGALRHRDGHRIEARFSNVPILINGVVTSYFSVVEDVTDSIRMQKHLQETEKLSLVGQLAASIAHEIRNPITALGGFLTLMGEQAAARDGQENESGTTTYLNIMRDELNRINLIVSQLLMLGKPQLEHFEEHDLRVIVSEVMSLLEPQVNMSSITLRVQLPETDVLLLCEKNQMKQALINVVKNAIEAAGNGGFISVTVEHEHTVPPVLAKIVVRDSGPGIPHELLGRLGEPFYTTKAAGTGLGLLVTKRIIQSHNGTLEFHSALGQGTTVQFAFPLTVEAADHTLCV
ncbi:PAS domain S-box protein [Alicyclobacillus tolerans]|uniref:ATP-binding protein n=1 Tax=Alicyclobacillus tolerans TaxID=90970 RepID=UPI001F2E4C92|nr:ATP-binding protein [Alicyclobacillus tolerans]MCF8565462.1 PAS domain S-box protein [Alicyclobacillus tolerans]